MTADDRTGAPQVLLQCGDARVVLDPGHGGAIREFSCGGRQVLRASRPDAGEDPFELASFPMVPYVNRIAHGRFDSGTRRVRLRRNWSGDPHPLHGQGWRMPWQVVRASASEATLAYSGGDDEWPWRYRAQQRFRVGRDALSVRLSVENLSPAPMPVALGMHPYFPDAAGAQLMACAARVWLTDGSALPVREVPVPASWSFDAGRPVAMTPLDHCFTQWNGRALLRWEDHSVVLQASHCRFLHVYVPPEGRFFCVEPQTAATGAFNRAPGEVMQLAPGRQFAMRVGLQLGGP